MADRGRLAVWMNGELVGTWANARELHAFDYAESWLRSEHARPLSLSMPLVTAGRLRGKAVENYFDNLLPDNEDIRRRIRQRYGVRSTGPFELLAEIGRDCVGAVQLLPVGEAPLDITRVDFEPLGKPDVEALLRNLAATPGFGAGGARRHGDFRISIAGAQEKTALLLHEGRWCKPLGTTPTTHILKPPLGEVTRHRADFSTSVENEWLCAQIVRALGLDVADTQMARFGEQRVLVVERFDREWRASPANPTSRHLVRIPQEDFCQALGMPHLQKYEKDGGPGMNSCLDLMGASESPHEARLHFLLSQFAFWLLAATDGHAKNFSIFLNRGGTFIPTPLYDVLSVWPLIGKGARQLPYQEAKLAMAMRSKNAHWALGEIQARHWQRLAMRAGGEAAWAAVLAMTESVDAALSRVEARLPRGFPPQVWDAVSKGIIRHKKAFIAGASGRA